MTIEFTNKLMKKAQNILQIFNVRLYDDQRSDQRTKKTLRQRNESLSKMATLIQERSVMTLENFPSRMTLTSTNSIPVIRFQGQIKLFIG